MSDDDKPLLTIYLPADAMRLGNLMLAIADIYPDCRLDNDVHGNILLLPPRSDT